MSRGDLMTMRTTPHEWLNQSQTKWARMLSVLLDAEPLVINGKAVEENCGKQLPVIRKSQGVGQGGKPFVSRRCDAASSSTGSCTCSAGRSANGIVTSSRGEALSSMALGRSLSFSILLIRLNSCSDCNHGLAAPSRMGPQKAQCAWRHYR